MAHNLDLWSLKEGACRVVQVPYPTAREEGLAPSLLARPLGPARVRSRRAVGAKGSVASTRRPRCLS
jgi:hypothetical protein